MVIVVVLATGRHDTCRLHLGVCSLRQFTLSLHLLASLLSRIIHHVSLALVYILLMEGLLTRDLVAKFDGVVSI